MVADAPTPEEAIRAFKEFCGDNILVAHNAHSFDMLFIRKAGEKAGVSWDENTYIDTLPHGPGAVPGPMQLQAGHHQPASGDPALQPSPRCR